MVDLGKRLTEAFQRMIVSAVKRVPDIVLAILLIAVFFIVALLVKRAAYIALRRSNVHANIVTLITRLVYYTIIVVGVIEALGQIGINLTALGAGIGIAGFAVGFALKDILSNFLSGILILWTRHFTVGDQIRIQEFEGTVEAIELRGTIMRTYDGRRVTIPNSNVYTNPVINNTIYSHRRSSITITVGYDVDLEEMERLIRAALENVPRVCDDPVPDVLVTQFANYAVQVEIRIWTPAQQLDVLTVNSEAAKAVKSALESHEIYIVTPMQVDILNHDKEKS